jgi:hypothetical protein
MGGAHRAAPALLYRHDRHRAGCRPGAAAHLSFVVFKSPAVGGTHIFRPGEPMLQILIVPVTSDFTLVPMDEGEAAEREMPGRRVHAQPPHTGSR